ncbi:MAG: hypothetical protein R3281_05090 [Balneolaceae bacterium]|nr:hypothetical protein [Balneolaceae bacterium]
MKYLAYLVSGIQQCPSEIYAEMTSIPNSVFFQRTLYETTKNHTVLILPIKTITQKAISAVSS